MTLISFHARLEGVAEEVNLGTVNVEDGTERSAATIAAAMHDVAERIDVWARFRKITKDSA